MELSSDSDISVSSESDCDSDSSVEDISSVRNWCKINKDLINPAPPRFPFMEHSSMLCNINDANDPLEYFTYFFDDDVIQHIVDETNLFAQQYFNSTNLTPRSRCTGWTDTNKSEMRLFLSLIILEGIQEKPREAMYWSRIPSIETPYFNKIMTEKRFSLIMKFLHFANNEEQCAEETANPLKKIEILMKKLIAKFREAYIPDRDLSIDESLLMFKGRLGWKQYIPSKRARFGIKFFVMCESSSGYVINFLIYTGKNTTYSAEYNEFGTATKCVLTLLEGYLDKGYCVTVDNFYNSPQLAEILIKRRTDIYGTLRINRKDVPADIKSKKLKKGELIAFQKGKIMIMKWQDKRPVAILSTIHSTEMVQITKRNTTIEKPKAVVEYNHTMGGVDRMDASIANYSIKRKQRKYYKKIFRQFLDLSVWNSFVLYKKNGGELNHLFFRIKLVDRLTEENIFTEKERKSVPQNISALRFEGNHFPSYVPATPKKSQPSRRCYICCRKNDETGKKIRKETRFQCTKCNVGLCVIPCFEIFHTKE